MQTTRLRSATAACALSLALATIAIVGASGAARAAPLLSTPAQACINAMNEAGKRLGTLKGKAILKCLGDALDDKLQPGQTAQDCLTIDPRGKLAKAETKTTSAEAASCTQPPSFGYTSAATVNAAATSGQVALFTDLLGSDLVLAVAAVKNGGKTTCFESVLKDVEKIAKEKAASFNACKKYGMEFGSITGIEGMEQCIDPGITDDPKVSNIVEHFISKAQEKCYDIDVDNGFPGACADAPSFAQCVDQRVECSACRTLNSSDGMHFDCDMFDDGVANSSCPPLP